MISLVALVLAVVSAGCQGALVPLGYSGNQILPFHPLQYAAGPITYRASLPAPVTYSAPITYSVPSSYSSSVVSAPVPAPLTYTAAVAPAPVTYSAPVVAAPAPLTYSAPVVAAPAPVTYAAAIAAPVGAQTSQFHSQDELGGYSFGYAGGPSSRTEYRDHFGNVRGSYNYIDNDGEVQTTHYSAGPEGFQVAATNLPVAPLAEEPAALTPVQETPEVAAARSAFLATFNEAKDSAVAEPIQPADATPAEPGREDVVVAARKKRSTPVVAVHGTPVYPQLTYPFQSLVSAYPQVPLTYSGAVPVVAAAHAPLTYSGVAPVVAGAHVPLAYSGVAPVVAAAPLQSYREAELLRVTNNPGHATSYRVY